PEETEELKHFYPTSTLITSRDIITLWVARMVLTGLYNMGDIPFHQVYIHPKILDGYGETMSKSKGNGVDPLDVIDQFGADALRFGLAYLTTETQDVRMPVEFVCPHCNHAFKQTKKNRVLPRVACDKCGQEFHTQWAQEADDLALPRGTVTSERFELGRNFCNKLWNASRFALMNLEGYEAAVVTEDELLIEDRWLLSRQATVTGAVTTALAEFRYADAARELYSFAWDDFCSFYVEITKARFAVPEQRAVAQRVLAHALDTLLRLLHPMIPFLTEEVWQLLGTVAPERGLAPSATTQSICIAPWPESLSAHIDTDIEKQFAQFQAVMSAVRNIRTENNIPPKEFINFNVTCDNTTATLLKPMAPYFESIARAEMQDAGPTVPTSLQVASKLIDGGVGVHVDISDFFDVEAEQQRLNGEKEKLAKYVKSLQGKLRNENFVSRAPAEVVEAERAKLREVEEQLSAVEAALAKL
ncbi:MAG: class I tRNA ligase family protein, partial [Bythopirellula sp.]